MIVLASCSKSAPAITDIPTEPNTTIETEALVVVDTSLLSRAVIVDQLPEGYVIVDTKEGEELIFQDLDGDERIDAVALIQMRGDTTYDMAEAVKLAIFSPDRHGIVLLNSISGNLGGESVAYADHKKLSVKKNVIQYYHQSMRNEVLLKFRYDIYAADYQLIGKEYKNYGGIEDGPYEESINYLTNKKIIRTSKWDDEKEEQIALPESKVHFEKQALYLSEINWDSLYHDLY